MKQINVAVIFFVDEQAMITILIAIIYSLEWNINTDYKLKYLVLTLHLIRILSFFIQKRNNISIEYINII